MYFLGDKIENKEEKKEAATGDKPPIICQHTPQQEKRT